MCLGCNRGFTLLMRLVNTLRLWASASCVKAVTNISTEIITCCGGTCIVYYVVSWRMANWLDSISAHRKKGPYLYDVSHLFLPPQTFYIRSRINSRNLGTYASFKLPLPIVSADVV